MLSTGKKTGILAITRGNVQKEICFKDGNIIYANSKNDAGDFLGNLLIRRGKITKVELEKALHLHKSSGKRLGMVLVDMGLFGKEEISDCLRLQIEEIIYNLFSWPEGEFIFQEGKLPQVRDVFVELQTMSIIMEGTRRIDEWLEIQKALPKDNEILKVVLSPQMRKGEISLSLEEFQVLSTVDGQRTLPDILSISPIGEFPTYRGIHKLIQAGLVETAGTRAVEASADPNEDEQLWMLILRLYSACFEAIRRKLERMFGSQNVRVNEMLATYRKGVWAYFTGIESTDIRSNFQGFQRTVQKIPKEARLHRILTGLNYILAEQLSFVRSMLGINVLRAVESEIKKSVSLPLAEKRAICAKYDLEDDIFQVIRGTKKTAV